MSSIFGGIAPSGFGGDTGALGTDFVANHAGNVTGVYWFQAPTGGPATVTVALYDTQTQTLLSSQLSGALVANSWNLINLPAPIAITPGKVYTAVGFKATGENIGFTNNHLLATGNYRFNTDLTGIIGRTNNSGVLAFPASLEQNGASFGVDVEFAQTPPCPDCPPCPPAGAGPCIAPTGADPAYDIATAILNCAWFAVDNTGDLTIQRKCVVPGEVAWDNCQCGQLVVSEERRYGSREFPLEEVTSEAECGEPYLVVVLHVNLTRCVPTMDQNGNPPACDALDTAARQLMRDKRNIRSAVMCCLTQIYDASGSLLMAFQLGGHETIGPEGMCAGSDLTILLGFANPCGC